MYRCALLVLCVVAACSKSAGNQDKVSSPPASGGDVIAVPTAGAPRMGGPKGGQAPRSPGDDDRFKLKPEEGKLAIEAPADAKAGAEAVATITVTPGQGYHVNTEYPTKLTLTAPAGVTLAKDKFIAGGHDKAQGDADALDEKRLAISVKLTAAASGSYTINGNFKFAVCDRDQCLAKQETIAIAVAAK
ncbi:MAG TPA: hypothetical protein VGD80_31065 [Kofleriaceae bacterium]